jgi:hypothetical protein
MSPVCVIRHILFSFKHSLVMQSYLHEYVRLAKLYNTTNAATLEKAGALVQTVIHISWHVH